VLDSDVLEDEEAHDDDYSPARPESMLPRVARPEKCRPRSLRNTLESPQNMLF
jgi:hypothetical protein